MQRVKELVLRLELTKFENLKPELENLAYLITAEGLKPNPKQSKEFNHTIFHWTTDCEKSFFDLKHTLIMALVLIFPDVKRQFTLTINASIQGLGAVLSQENHPC